MKIKLAVSVILAVGITVSNVITAFGESQRNPHPDIISGDVNGDYVINVIDATTLQKILAGIPVTTISETIGGDTLFDFNLDGVSNVSDVTEIQRYVARLCDDSAGIGVPGYTWVEMDTSGGEYVPVTLFYQENPLVKEFISNTVYSPSDSEYSAITAYAAQSSSYKKSRPFGAEIVLKDSGNLVITDSYSGAVIEKSVNAGKYTLYNLTPRSVSTFRLFNDGKLIQYGALYPLDCHRMIFADKTLNIRDIGGWKCDGGKVKYGRIYRGGEISETDIELFRDILKIQSEITLRYKTECPQNYSLIGENVSWTQVEGPWYNILPSEADEERKFLKAVFDSVKHDLPVYVHCAAGADRTGTQMCILEALLGISQSDIEKDYELTTFYSGVIDDLRARRRNEREWQQLIAVFSEYEGETLNERVISWVKALGFSTDDINVFREKMIEGSPRLLSL